MATNTNRPTSPHLQIYKLPLTGIISISHRMTGVLLTLGLVLFVLMISAVAGGSESYSAMQAMMNTWLAKLVLWGFIYALFFHLCHGVRHLLWDAGQSFDKETLNRYAVVELASSLLLTLLTWLIF
ncbi:MAG: succinate dehydrogenase, cytochrome b556 subunit [Methylovulum sp.]|jgi:succinate dehydrogenase / fumarate reductase cytochrome b subunit|nr:succinate dehydrogenase, cytochrome b556 subunit [Methylovulum sp.]MCF7997662.1 succinate dehydrogenase, cytochrome b556 subunit [Methylovulum sp.]